MKIRKLEEKNECQMVMLMCQKVKGGAPRGKRSGAELFAARDCADDHGWLDLVFWR